MGVGQGARSAVYTMDLYAFEQKLKFYIEKGGRSQAAVARLLGHRPDTFNKWVHSVNKMPFDVLHEFCRLHGLEGEQQLELFQLLGYEILPLEPQKVVKVSELRAERVVVEHLEVATTPTRPTAPLRTRIPDPRAARLVGRSDELDWLCERLRAGGVAAIAGVRGIGGIGKTELAIAAASELESHFEGRVIWLDCGPNDTLAIQERLAAAAGTVLDSEDPQVRADALALALRQQPPTLVVLDDLRRRHLADFGMIAPPRPPCALAVTSRRSDLPLPGQAIWHLDTLAPPQSQELLTTLLPAGWLAAEPAAAEEIAGLLEHVPLALTLAGRRAERIGQRRDGSASQPLATLLDELRARRIQVVNQGEDPERPDLSMVITFDASYEDLDPTDQARLRRLGVFARNEFELPALKAVWGDDERPARQALERLVNAGLLEEPGQRTWWMHDLLREYATERLGVADPGEEQSARLAHAAYWQRYLDDLELLDVDDWQNLAAHRPEVEQAADWLLGNWRRAPGLAAELAVTIHRAFTSRLGPNWEAWLLAGLAAAEAAEQRDTIRYLQCSLGVLYTTVGNVARADELLHASLVAAKQLQETAATDQERAALKVEAAVTQTRLAFLLHTCGEYDEAERLYRESIQVLEEVGARHTLATTKPSLAVLLRDRGKYTEAERLYGESLPILEEEGNCHAVAITKAAIAGLCHTRGDYKRAEGLYRESLQILDAVNDYLGKARTQSALADLLLQQGKYDEAEQLYRGSIQIKDALGDRIGKAQAQSELADLLRTRGEYKEAEQLYREGLEVVRDGRSKALIQESLALLLRTRGELDEAEQLYRDSLRTFKTVGDRRMIAVAQAGLASVLMARGEYNEAERLCRQSLKISEKVGDPREIALRRGTVARLLVFRREPEEAERLYRESLDLLKVVGDQRELVVFQSELADLLCALGHYDEAEQLYKSGLEACRAISDRQGIAVFLKGLGNLAKSRGQPEKAVDLLRQARQEFLQLQLHSWVASVDRLLASVQDAAVPLGRLVALLRRARQGDQEAGQQAWEICQGLGWAQDETTAILGRALQRLLAGVSPEAALANLPDDLRTRILEGLDDRS